MDDAAAAGAVRPPRPDFSFAAWAPHGYTAESLSKIVRRTPEISKIYLRADQEFERKPGAGEGVAFARYFECLHDPLHGGPWLDPRDPGVRRAVAARAAEEAKKSTEIHLDYVRCGTSPDPETREAVTLLVGEIAEAVRAAAPGTTLSAAVFPTPESALEHNQDWMRWVREGLVDYVCPMLYENDSAGFRASLRACLDAAPAEKLVPGIGNGADGAQTGAAAFREETAAAAAAGCRGAAFFPLDESLPPLFAAAKDAPRGGN